MGAFLFERGGLFSQSGGPPFPSLISFVKVGEVESRISLWSYEHQNIRWYEFGK